MWHYSPITCSLFCSEEEWLIEWLLYSSGSSTDLAEPMDIEYVIHPLVSIYIICKHVDRRYYNYSYSGII
jgi:hypothetical protein